METIIKGLTVYCSTPIISYKAALITGGVYGFVNSINLRELRDHPFLQIFTAGINSVVASVFTNLTLIFVPDLLLPLVAPVITIATGMTITHKIRNHRLMIARERNVIQEQIDIIYNNRRPVNLPTLRTNQIDENDPPPIYSE